VILDTERKKIEYDAGQVVKERKKPRCNLDWMIMGRPRYSFRRKRQRIGLVFGNLQGIDRSNKRERGLASRMGL